MISTLAQWSAGSIYVLMLILGCGYVGTALARVALAAGEPVAALTRNAAGAARLRALGCSPVVEADLAGDAWHAALNPAGESIVDCVSPSAAGEDGYRHAFVGGAQSIARWLAQSAASGRPPARALVFTSSTGVYPQTDGEWVDENAPVDSTVLSPSGEILREAEQIFLSLPPSQLRRAWVLRFGGLYGPGRHQLLDALQAGETSFPGGGDHWVNLLHLDDAVAAIRSCLQAPLEISGGIFNAVDDEPVRKRDLVAWLAAQLKMDAATIQFTGGAGGRSTHRTSVSGRVPHRKISNARLKNLLGWSPVSHSFREGYGKISAAISS